MFGFGKKRSGAVNLADLFNNMSEDCGAENFAAILNNMGARGGTKLGTMLNQLTAKGSANHTAFVNSATPDESVAFSSWLEKASDAKIRSFCDLLNATPIGDPILLARAISRFFPVTVPSKKLPVYDLLKAAVIAGRLAEVAGHLDSGFDLNSRNSNGEVILLTSVCMGDARLDFTQLFVEHGADVNATVNGRTILEIIRDPVYCDNSRTIALLISNGAVEPARTAATRSDSFIRFICPAPMCRKRLKAEVRHAGRKTRCMTCGSECVIPLPKSDEVREAKSSNSASTTNIKRDRWDVMIFGDEIVHPTLKCDLCGDNRVAFGFNGTHRVCQKCRTVFCRRNCMASIHGQCPRCGECNKLDGLTVPNIPEPSSAEPPASSPAPALSGRDAAKRYNDLSNTSDRAEAERNLRSAIEADPTFDIPYCNLGRLFYEQGRYEEARDCLILAMRLGIPGTAAYDQSVMLIRMVGFR